MPEARVALYASVGPELTHYDVDVAAGTLARRQSLRLPANVHYVWPHASASHLYAALSNAAPGAAAGAGAGHALCALRVDAASGALAPHGEPVALPARPIHLTTDIASEYALVAFSNPSGLRVYRINPDMTAGAEVAQKEPIDPGIYAHQVRVYPAGRLVILVARGNDAAAGRAEDPGALKVFRYEAGRLSHEVSVAPGGGYGFGPRHLDFHPEKPWVYVSLERQNRLDMFRIDGERLAATPSFAKGTLSRPADPRIRQAAGTVHVHPSGRYVYVANRASSTIEEGGQRIFAGGENTLAVYGIDPESGEPSAIHHADTRGIHCRTFHIDPSGRLLVAAHIMALPVRDGDTTRTVPACLSLFHIAEDGRLEFRRKYDVEVGDKTMFWMGMLRLL
jgi:6-phosphogluconolactonase